MSKQWLKLNRQTRQKFDHINRLNQLQSMDPVEFEQFVGHLYQKEGYRVAMTVTTGDEGIDLFLRRGLSTAVVQCKRYSGTVGQPTVRDLYGAMVHTKARRAMLVTSGSISRPAEDWAKGKPIDLIDGHELMSWARRSRGFNASRLFAMRSWVVGLVIFVALVALLYQGVSHVGALSDLLTAVPDISDLWKSDPQPVLVPALQQGIVIRQIDINGDLSDWTGIPEYPSGYRVAETAAWDGSDDLGATWQLAWSRTHLFIGASVTDDVIVSATPGKELNGDQLLLLLDTNQANGNGLAADVYRIALLPGNFTGKLPATQLAQGGSAGEFLPISGPGMQIATRQTKTGYDLEAAVPWNVLQLTPAADLEMRALLEAVDSDDTATAAPEVIYAQLRQRQLDDPTTWGTFILESEP